MSPEEYKLVQYMKEPKPSDTSDKLLSPMPGALVSYTVKVSCRHTTNTILPLFL